MKPEELLSIIGIYEAELVDLYNKFCKGKFTEKEYNEKTKKPHNEQMKVVNRFKEEIIEDCKNELLKHTFLMRYENCYPSEAVPKVTIFELLTRMKLTKE